MKRLWDMCEPTKTKQGHPPKLTGWARAAPLKEAAKRHISGGAPKVNGAGGFEKK